MGSLKYNLLILFINYAMAVSYSTIKEDVKNSDLIVVGEVLESDGSSHLIKLNHWNKNFNNSNYMKIKAKKDLSKFSTYLFVIDDFKEEIFKVSDPKKNIFEIKNMGEYKFLIREYQSDKPMIGQIGIKTMVDFMKKELKLDLKSRSLSRYEKNSYSKRSVKRSIASYKNKKSKNSKLSVYWLISIFTALFGISILFRKSKV